MIRIYKGLLGEDGARAERDFAFYLEEAALVTLGQCYESKGNFAGGAYYPILRRLETFLGAPLCQAIHEHERRAELLFDLEERVQGKPCRAASEGGAFVLRNECGTRPVLPAHRPFQLSPLVC